MKSLYIKSLAVVLLLTTAACSNNDWTPGPDVDPGCMTVFFEPIKSYDVVIEPDDSRLFPVTIGRAKTDEAASVAINVVSAPEGVVVPSTVDFEVGQETQTIFIDLENMASKSSGTISLALPENMTSPYGAGNPTLDLNVTVSGAWLPLGEDVVIYFSKNYEPINSSLYLLDGTYNFKIPNFLNSGVDFVFTVAEPGEGTLRIIPVKNYMDVKEYWGSDYSYNGWVLYDEATETVPEWSIDGTYPYISLFEFDADYATIDVANGYIFFGPYIYFTDGTSNYIDQYIYFTPLFNPFSQPAE